MLTEANAMNNKLLFLSTASSVELNEKLLGQNFWPGQILTGQLGPKRSSTFHHLYPEKNVCWKKRELRLRCSLQLTLHPDKLTVKMIYIEETEKLRAFFE